ncbi:Ig-like domain-containing protein [Roseovarius sp. MMSF_3281]|uniref:Ig-like domain-containing protein n=1 Tax=Roseovarius sp. MMSF_3281 TaxID=3046694 RepID=UPI00273E048D|nr:Ig-like domain-containing protein [Roseovarius sp. MMSF_3281]
MKAIDYVARTNAGVSQRGSVSEGNDVSVIPAGNGQEISLNLRQIDIANFDRDGSNLVINLADGRVVVLEGYFGEDGTAESRLFISADGYLNEVTLIEGSEGSIYAQYGPTETWGKWSPSDDLIFLDGSEVAPAVSGEEEVSMLGAGLLGGSGLMSALGLGAAGVAAASVVASDDGDGGPTRIEPKVNEDAPIVVGGDDTTEDDKSITITGEAEPDSEVTVTIGDESQTTTADENGEWDVTFEGENFPDDGDYAVDVTVTEPDGTETELDGPSVSIDTTPPETSVEEGTLSTTGIVNDDDFQDGVDISGTGEAGSSVSVTIEEHTETVTVSEDGTWSVTFDPADLPEGDYETEMTVVSTDSLGNSSTITETVSIDTVYNALEITTGSSSSNSLINAEAVQSEGGVVITGTTEPGATVIVDVGGTSQEVTADGDGNWQATFDPADLPSQQFEATVTATTTDEAGNTTTTSNTVEIDLVVQNFSHEADIGGDDNVISASEVADGFTLTGTVEPGSTVKLEFEGSTVWADVDPETGAWTASFSGAQVPGGDYSSDVIITATDAANNVQQLSQSVRVDTDPGSLTMNGIGDNGVINFDAYDAGIEVTGTANPNAQVEVNFNGVVHTVTANGSGQWTSTFTKAELPSGDYDAQVTATVGDVYGNSYSVDQTVDIDTIVENLTVETPEGMPTTAEGLSVINQDKADGGFEITGTVETGSTVWVVIDGVRRQAEVDEETGEWVARFEPGAMDGHQGEVDMVVEVEDGVGNLDTIPSRVLIDTVVDNLGTEGSPETVNGVVGLDAARDGMELTGTAEPGSAIAVSLFNQSYTATADASGNWSLIVPHGDIPAAEDAAQFTVQATDIYGNVDTTQGSVTFDMVAPDQPDIVGYFREGGGYRYVTTMTNEEDVTIHQVEGGGINELSIHDDVSTFTGETDHFFLNDAGQATSIPDGSQLIVTNTDDAGNASSTYVVLDEVTTTVVDLSNGNLNDFQIETVDLRFGDQSEMTITEEQLLALSDNTDTLIVEGGADDTVTITGANKVDGGADEPAGYDIYSLGDDATLVVDEDIEIVT